MGTTSLHHAIWDGKIGIIESILQLTTGSSLLEEQDEAGNTPLMLALRSVQPMQEDIVNLLLKYGASCHTKDHIGWTCIQNATLCDNDRLMANVFVHAEKQTYNQLMAKSTDFYNVLQDVPDFYVEIRVELTSWVPLVSLALPSDVLRIWKKGSNIRCDFSIKDFNNTSWKRGHMSYILRTYPNQYGHIATIDWDTNEVNDVTTSMVQPTIADIETGLQLLYTCKTSTFSTDVTSMVFKPKKRPLIKSKKSKRPWRGIKFEMQHVRVNMQMRDPILPHWQRLHSSDDRIAKVGSFLTKLSKQQKKSSVKHDSYTLVLEDTPMEMHLQVQPRDVILWSYQVPKKASNVVFNVFFCPNDSGDRILLANNTTQGAREIGSYGNAVLSWQRTGTKKSIVVKYQIQHQRPTAPIPELKAPASPVESLSPLDAFKRPCNPSIQSVSYVDYFNSTAEGHVQHRAMTVLPRTTMISRELNATVTMSEEFPFSVKDFLPVAVFLSTRAEHFESLREFFEMKLPAGFPIKFQLPILLSVRASYTFEKAEACTVDDSHFDI
ncbi:hypothetical protein THRCLA_04954, partial [Thraustotheca clavata]